MGSMYDLKDIPGKGKGLVANRNIPRGTRILCEEAIIQTSQSYDRLHIEELKRRVTEKFNALTDKHKHAFLSLRNVLPYKSPAEQYLGILHTNAFPIQDGGIGGGIFLKASRINHACDKNAHNSWNKNIKRHTIHAIRDINQGEEITISYLAVHRSRQDRQKTLRTQFKFECSCRLCSLPAEESRKSDKMLEDIYRQDCLVDKLGLRGISSAPLAILHCLDREVQLYNMTGADDPGLSKVYWDAAQVTIAHGDLARGRIFAERALQGWRISCGSDSQPVINFGRIPQDPSRLSLYGMSKQWTTAVNEVPNQLEPTQFEDWLWKRERLPNQGA